MTIRLTSIEIAPTSRWSRYEKRTFVIWRILIDGQILGENVAPFSASDRAVWQWVHLKTGIEDTDFAVSVIHLGNYVFWISNVVSICDLPIPSGCAWQFELAHYRDAIGFGDPNKITSASDDALIELLRCVRLPNTESIMYCFTNEKLIPADYVLRILQDIFSSPQVSVTSCDRETFRDIVFGVVGESREFVVRVYRRYDHSSVMFALRVVDSPMLEIDFTAPMASLIGRIVWNDECSLG